jgi:hypothetical protein
MVCAAVKQRRWCGNFWSNLEARQFSVVRRRPERHAGMAAYPLGIVEGSCKAAGLLAMTDVMNLAAVLRDHQAGPVLVVPLAR